MNEANLLHNFKFPPISKEKAWKHKGFLRHVASFGCIRCGLPAQVHHTIYKSKGKSCSDLLTVGLCNDHHTGTNGVHTKPNDPFYSGEVLNEFIWRSIKSFAKKHNIEIEIGEDHISTRKAIENEFSKVKTK